MREQRHPFSAALTGCCSLLLAAQLQICESHRFSTAALSSPCAALRRRTRSCSLRRPCRLTHRPPSFQPTARTSTAASPSGSRASSDKLTSSRRGRQRASGTRTRRSCSHSSRRWRPTTPAGWRLTSAPPERSSAKPCVARTRLKAGLRRSPTTASTCIRARQSLRRLRSEALPRRRIWPSPCRRAGWASVSASAASSLPFRPR